MLPLGGGASSFGPTYDVRAPSIGGCDSPAHFEGCHVYYVKVRTNSASYSATGGGTQPNLPDSALLCVCVLCVFEMPTSFFSHQVTFLDITTWAEGRSSPFHSKKQPGPKCSEAAIPLQISRVATPGLLFYFSWKMRLLLPYELIFQ